MAYEDLISRMTLEEKCALLQGASSFGTFAIPGLGIPELQFSDGPHGMRHQDPETANHLGIGGSLPATCFPTAATAARGGRGGRDRAPPMPRWLAASGS